MRSLFQVLTLVSYCVSGVVAEQVTITAGDAGKECIVKAAGRKVDDTPAILEAFRSCNGGGKVIFPRGEEYWIATRLNPVVHDIRVEWRGQWKV
jgi:polygalacturonase